MAARNDKGRGRGTGGRVIDGGSKLTPLQKALLREAAREVSIVSDGRPQNVRMDEIVTRKMMQTAAKGGQHSISNAFYQINLAQRLDQQNIDNEVAFGHRYKAYQQHLLNEAEKCGWGLETVLPHPDDIVIKEGVGYEVVGPANEIELRAVKSDCAKRDLAILQAVLEERLGSPDNGLQTSLPAESPDASALLMVHIFNENLPTRFQKSDIQLVMDLMQYDRLSKRELLKRAYGQWRSVGRPKARGWRMPPSQIILSAFERMMPVMMTIHQESLGGKMASVSAIAVRLERAWNQHEPGSRRWASEI